MYPNDFTYAAYAALLDGAVRANYEFLTVAEYLRRDAVPPRFLVVRHDVDRKPSNALDLARIAADRGVEATFYFRPVSGAFDASVVRRVASLGHEVGYQYDDVDRAAGDVPRARQLFGAHLERLRECVPVTTACSRTSALTTYDNGDIWDDDHGYERYELLGDATLSMDFDVVTQFSDDGHTWRNDVARPESRPRVGSHEGVPADGTDDLIDLFDRRRVSRACLVVHPNYWVDSYPEFVAERTRDVAVTAAKRGLDLFS